MPIPLARDAERAHCECAVCRHPVVQLEAGADVRIYLGPCDKLAELWLPLCPYHLDRFRIAHDRVIVECPVAYVSARRSREAQQ